MIPFYNGECDPGVSMLRLSDAELSTVNERYDGDGLSLLVARNTCDYAELCRQNQRQAILDGEVPGLDTALKRQVASRLVKCCMSRVIRPDETTGGAIVLVTTQPGCAGRGETIPHPDRFVVEGITDQIAILHCE